VDASQILYGLAVAIKALSPQNQKCAEMGDSSQSRLRLDREFLGSIVLFSVDQTVFHSPHLFNGIAVRAFDRSIKIDGGGSDTDCIECFFHLVCLMR
jgi:hypothetical protein